jgi:hypothetical protein
MLSMHVRADKGVWRAAEMSIALAFLVVISASLLSQILEQRRETRAVRQVPKPGESPSRYVRLSLTLPDAGRDANKP